MLERSLHKFRYINYLLWGLIVLALLLLIRNIVSTSFAKKDTPSASMTEPALNKKTVTGIMQYADILEKNPFGRPMKLIPIAIEKKTSSQHSSPSGLILVGTVVGQGKQSYAIIEDKSQSAPAGQDLFAIGEEVYDYGVLSKITMISVEIVQNSIIHTLTIPFDTSGVASDSFQAGPGNQADRSGSSFAKQVGEREYVLDGRTVREALKNPEQILTDARLLPNIINGRQEGFAISEVVPDGLYNSLGLKNGDVLLKINGLEISNPEVAMQAMSALRGMNRVNLDVIRNGKNMSMSYRIK